MTPLGSIMVDVAGYALTGEERQFLKHPLIGGIILFSRNYCDPDQLRLLTSDIKSLRQPSLLIAVDHEGGRVQRFRDGFTLVPPMRRIGELWSTSRPHAMQMAKAIGFIIGYELSGHGVDFSFTPVLDVDYGSSEVIGNRAFSSDPTVVGALAGEMVSGLSRAGVSAVGKHFPGHGFVSADSHVAIPRDERTYPEIDRSDLTPYRMVIAQGLGGIMPAHVIYSAIDSKPAGFSVYWIQEVLRKRLAFDGVVFSDDLMMEGAETAGGIADRAKSAFTAGCDMVLICNAPEQARLLVRTMESAAPTLHQARAENMRARSKPDGNDYAHTEYAAALDLLAHLRE